MSSINTIEDISLIRNNIIIHRIGWLSRSGWMGACYNGKSTNALASLHSHLLLDWNHFV